MTSFDIQKSNFQWLSLFWLLLFAGGTIVVSINREFAVSKLPFLLLIPCLILAANGLMYGQFARSARVLLTLAIVIMSQYSILRHGGFQSPRTVLSIVMVTLSMIVIWGERHGITILMVAGASTLTLVFLDVVGFLQRIQAIDVEAVYLLEYVLSPLSLLLIFLCFGLIIRVLKYKQREAELAQAAESKFLSNMSHEIRNPLNAIQGVLEQISTADSADLMREDSKIGLRVTDQLKALLDDVLDYQKLRAGELEIRNQCFDSDELRAALNNTFHSMLKGSGKALSLQLNRTPDLPKWVYGDAHRIFQVATNLISNAIKFTDSGHITLTSHYDVEAELFSFEVADTGAGMSPETFETLFKRFKQGSEGLAKVRQGTGLGLAISNELVTLMGGTLSVESTLGSGSSFRMTIPAPPCEAPVAASSSVVNPNESPEELDLQGLTFLCVDDDLINLKVLRAPLQAAGAEVLTALSGIEALALLEQQGVHMVLTDISMPEMDGVALRGHIGERFPELPVIAVTGNALPSDLEYYRAQGFADTLSKPYKRSDLLALVSDNLIKAFGPAS